MALAVPVPAAEQIKARGHGSAALGHEADVISFDRDPDIDGIRALDSCRARQYRCSISAAAAVGVCPPRVFGVCDSA
jgi:hypothetical protein